MNTFSRSSRVALLSLAAIVALAGGCMKEHSTSSSHDNMSKDAMNKPMAKSMDAPMNTSKPGDIIDVAVGPGMSRVTTLVAAVKAADLVETLKGPGPFTVFAPTNEAFAKLPPGTLDMLLKPENKDKLRNILLHHVHVGAAVPAASVRTMSLSTASGQPLNVVVDRGNVMVSGAKVIKTDVMASNGVIHWIDSVIVP